MWWWIALACTTSSSPPTAPAVLHPPFAGAADVLQPFDHAPGEPQVLRHDGRRVPGTQGHSGVDFDLPAGHPVLAAADGHVISAGVADPFPCPLTGQITSDQLQVRIRHPLPGGGYLDTAYAHLDTVTARPRSRVRRGEAIGTAGQSGCAAGAHLHFAVWWAPAPAAPPVIVDPFATSSPPRPPAGTPPASATPLWARLPPTR